MGLSRSDFADFFAGSHNGHAPFRWQERLLDAVLDDGRWPDQIVAPTGSGKTAVIDVHVFAQALTANDPAAGRPPRRLSLVVGRRVLVDDQYEYACSLADRLAVAAADSTDDVIGEVARRLWLLRRPWKATPVAGDLPLVTGKLRGGQPPSRGWRIEPTAAAVLCATPDMWGSRLLFRGYGSSRRAWPVEAGLLAFDTAVVVDEAHLARQLLVTARRVSCLAGVAERPVPLRPLQVVETTATPAGNELTLTALGVDESDLDRPGAATLQQRLTRPKPVTLLPVPAWTGTRDAQRRVVTATIADAVQAQLPAQRPDDNGEAASGAGRTVGCFVNTVPRAVDVSAECRRRGLRVVMVCGRSRPADLERLRREHNGVLDVRGSDDVDVVVATQSLEVGVDLDFASMVTELAEGSALAQRAGRLNRRGLRPMGTLTVVVPQGGVEEGMRSGPYATEELASALDWVQRRAADPAGVSPWRLRVDPPPPARPRRIAYQRPELAHAWHWARTSDELAAEPELNLWLAEDLDDDPREVGLVVREALPDAAVNAIRLVTDLPPRRFETFPVGLRAARELLRDWRATWVAAAPLRKRDHQAPVAVVVRGEETVAVEWRTHVGPGREPVLRPGDTVVIEADAQLFTASTAGRSGFSPPVPVPAAGPEGIEGRHPAQDVLTGDRDRIPLAGEVVLRLEPGLLPAAGDGSAADWAALVDALHPPEASDGSPDDAQRAGAVLNWLSSSGLAADWPMAAAAAELLADPAAKVDVMVHERSDAAGEDVSGDADALTIARVLVIDRRRLAADDAVRQAWTPSRRPVTLDVHQSAVATRADAVGAALGLDTAWAESLRLAGAHHDDGKVDDRFQTRLGRGADDPVLAKSRPGLAVSTVRRRELAAGLPRGWRHEQLSVLHSWSATRDMQSIDPELIARLVGTSHGHGRAGFPHVAGELAAGLGEEAVELFDSGGWDALMERTQRRYGVWTCAYLEAVLRAADNQVSGEGS